MGQKVNLRFKKRKSVKREVSRVQKRIQLLPDRDIVAWAESSIYDIARNLSAWQKKQDQFYLNEATLAAEVLYEALETVKRRTDA
jgi:hypothetical protein